MKLYSILITFVDTMAQELLTPIMFPKKSIQKFLSAVGLESEEVYSSLVKPRNEQTNVELCTNYAWRVQTAEQELLTSPGFP